MTGHIRRRGERSWEIKFDLGTDPSTGQRLTRYHSFKGTKKEAEAELIRLKAGADKGEYVDPTKITVVDFVEKWLTGWAATNVSPKTFERYGDLLRGHVVPHLGKVLLQRLSPLDLTELYAKLLREGRGEVGGLAPRTVLHVHRVVHRALRHGVQWRMLNSNVASSVDAPRAATTEISVIPPDAVKTMLTALARRNTPTAPALHRLISLALATGMRRGELLALRWQDVDLDGAAIRVERSLEQTRKGLRFKAPKTKYGRRTITLPGFAVTALKAHWKDQQEVRLALGLGKAPPEALAFPGVDLEPRSPNALSKEWTAAAAAVGVDVTFHALRHIHASQLIRAGLDVLTVSRRLGHGSPAITLSVYSHLFPDTDSRAAKALEAAYAPGTE